MRKEREPRVIKSKFSGICRDCGQQFNRGDEIIYYPATRSASHYKCGKDKYENWLADRTAAKWDEEQHQFQTQHLGM